MPVQSWAPWPCVTHGGLRVARRCCVHSATAAAACTAAAAGGRGESRCGVHACTFGDQSHGRQPCAPYLGCVWWGKATWHNSRVYSAAGKLEVAGNGRGVIVGSLQQYQKRWAFVRMTIKSSGMAARTPWRAAATAAAGEVTEGSGIGVSSAVFFWSGNISRPRC